MLIELLVGVAGLLVFFLARRSFWQTIMIVAALMPAYLVRFAVGGIPTNALEVLIGAVALSVIITPSTRQGWHKAWQELPLSIKTSAGVFLMAAIVSTFISLHLRTSLGILKSWVVIPTIFAFLAYASKPSDKQIKQLLTALICSSTLVSLVALLTGFTEGRLQAFYDTPNSLALYVAPILVLTIWRKLTQITGNNFWLLGSIVIQLAALLGSQSVGGILSLVLSLLVGSLLWLKGEQRRRAIVFMGVGIGITLITFMTSGKISYLTQPLKNPLIHNSATVRLQLWSVGWDLIKENPILGIGLGQFEPVYQQKLHERFLNPAIYYPQPIPEFVFRDPHNWLLSFWINTGIFGLLGFIGLNAITLKKNWYSKNPINQAAVISILTLLIFGVVDTIFWKNDLSVLHFVLLAILLW